MGIVLGFGHRRGSCCDRWSVTLSAEGDGVSETAAGAAAAAAAVVVRPTKPRVLDREGWASCFVVSRRKRRNITPRG